MEMTQTKTANACAQSNPQAAFGNWFDGYLTAIISTAVLGGQVTFTVIVGDISDPATLGRHGPDAGPPKVFSRETVRFLVALSWLFFVSALGLAIVAKLVFCNVPFVGADGLKPGPSSSVLIILTLALNGLSVAAFLLLSVAVTAYVPIVGWMGVVLLSLYFVGVLWLWLIMNTGFRNSVVAPMTGPFRPEWSGSQDETASTTGREYRTNQAAHRPSRTV